MAWVNPNDELPQHELRVLIIGYYLVMAVGETPTHSDDIITQGYWDANAGRWEVEDGTLMQQIIHGYGRVKWWIEIPVADA